MGRPPCCDKSNVKRGLWTPEEDAKILAYVSNHGIGNWTLVPKKAGLNRCGKSCRLRWTNYLRPDLKHDSFTLQEEELIITLHEAIGSRWSLIAKRLPGRTDNDVKNYWNTKLKKKLMKMGIDPITHKPVSQVLSDLGSISSLSKNENLMMKNMIPTRIEPSNSKKNLILEQKQEEQAQPLEHQVQYHQVQHVLSEVASSSSSTSSSNLTRLNLPNSYSCNKTSSQAQMNPTCSSFDWSEFLHSDDPFMFQELQQCDIQRVMSSLNFSSLMQSEGEIFNDSNSKLASEDFDDVDCVASKEYQINKQFDQGHSFSGNSFVDGILNKDSEIIKATFPYTFDY